MDAKLKDVHTSTHTELATRVRSLVINLLATDEVFRAAVDKGIDKQHARVSKAIKTHVTAQTLPMLQRKVVAMMSYVCWTNALTKTLQTSGWTRTPSICYKRHLTGKLERYATKQMRYKDILTKC